MFSLCVAISHLKKESSNVCPGSRFSSPFSVFTFSRITTLGKMVFSVTPDRIRFRQDHHPEVAFSNVFFDGGKSQKILRNLIMSINIICNLADMKGTITTGIICNIAIPLGFLRLGPGRFLIRLGHLEWSSIRMESLVRKAFGMGIFESNPLSPSI